MFYNKVIHLLICDNLKPARAACRLLGFTIAISGDSLYSFSINFNVKITSTYLYYVYDSAIPTYLLFYKCNSFPSIFTKSPDEIVVEAVDFVEAIVLTARRNTLVISPYCVISLVKIFIFIEWLYSTPKVLCYVINKNIKLPTLYCTSFAVLCIEYFASFIGV